MSTDGSFPQRGPSTPVFQTTTSHTTYPAASTSTTAAYGVLVLIVIYYFLHYLEAYHLPLSELLWDSLVYVTPSKMLSLLDPKFSSSSAIPEAEDDKFNTPKGFDSQHHASKSNAMRRLIGLNGTGIMTAVQRTRTLSDLGSVFKSRPMNSLPGLGNWDHSCYQNSVIQGLASLESLPGYLRREEMEREEGIGEEGATRKALRELTESLNDEGNIGKTFWTPSALKSMSSWQQQDAQEYFSKVMDGLEKDAARVKKMRDCQVGLKALSTNDGQSEKGADSATGKSTPEAIRMSQLPEELQSVIVKNPLEGLLAQRVGCQRCGYVEGLSLVPFNCLTVPLGRQWMYDVRECLNEYTALEPINGVECAKCTLLHAKAQVDNILKPLAEAPKLGGNDDYNAQLARLHDNAQKRLKLIRQALAEEDFSDSALKKCQIPAKSYVSTTKSRQAVVARAPEALVIHINRSIFDERTGEQSKNQASVRFPKRFGLGFWCLGTQQIDSEERTIENWNTDPRQSMLEFDVNDQDLNCSPSYELRAVVTHYGRHENGHYICYRRSPYPVKAKDNADVGGTEEKEPWWRLSDEEVTEVSEETVLAQGGVFMLFYEQVPSSNRAQVPVFIDAPDETTMVDSTNPVETATYASADNTGSLAIRLELEDEDEAQNRIASVYPTPPPEQPATNVKETLSKPAKESSMQDLSPSIGGVAQPSSSPVQARDVIETPSSSSHAPTDTGHPPVVRAQRLEMPQTESTAPSPRPAKTVSPRTGREKGRRTGKAMESMAGYVQAN